MLSVEQVPLVPMQVPDSVFLHLPLPPPQHQRRPFASLFVLSTDL
jgi:hypothetical protein